MIGFSNFVILILTIPMSMRMSHLWLTRDLLLRKLQELLAEIAEL